MHDGYLNMYTLHKDGQKITLAPFAPHQISKPRTEEIPKDKKVFLSFLGRKDLQKRFQTKFPLASQNQADKHQKHALSQPGGIIWAHLRKERFPSKRKSKLMPQDDGLFEVVEKVNDHAYKVELLGEYGVSCIFNVTDLNPHLSLIHI